MRAIKIAFLALALYPSSAFASDPFRGFSTYITPEAMKPFARDLGGLMGSGLYHTGRSLGFGGFDLGVRYAMQFKPSSGNTVMQNTGVGGFGIPWLQAEIGMPFRLDGFIRAANYEGLTISGGGLRWGLSDVNDSPYVPQLMLLADADVAVHRSFSATHYSGGFALSWRLETLSPYIGASLDSTRLEVREAPAGSGLVGEHVTVVEPNFTLGFSFRAKHYVYISAAASYTHSRPLMTASTGIRF